MQKILWMLAFGACASLGTAYADELAMPGTAVPADTTPAPYATTPDEVTPAEPVRSMATRMPEKGQSMSAVLKQFGEPKIRHKPAGGETPRHPAITRFDYADFSVFFERGKVIDSVNPRKPAAIHHTDKLEPLDY